MFACMFELIPSAFFRTFWRQFAFACVNLEYHIVPFKSCRHLVVDKNVLLLGKQLIFIHTEWARKRQIARFYFWPGCLILYMSSREKWDTSLYLICIICEFRLFGCKYLGAEWCVCVCSYVGRLSHNCLLPGAQVSVGRRKSGSGIKSSMPMFMKGAVYKCA